MDWSKTTLFQVDERIAPTGSPERNLTHLVLSLPLACQAAIRPMPVGADDLETAAANYEYSLPEQLRPDPPRTRTGRPHRLADPG